MSYNIKPPDARKQKNKEKSKRKNRSRKKNMKMLDNEVTETKNVLLENKMKLETLTMEQFLERKRKPIPE